MSKKPLSYQEKLNSIKDYTALGINSSKYRAKNPNFTKTEKWLITRYYNLAKSSGYFEYDAAKNVFENKVKFVKTNKSKRNTKNIKGGKRFTGQFIPGAAPGDRVKGNKITKGNFTKTFIKLNFEDLPPDTESDEFDEIVYTETFNALAPYYDEVINDDYFTIVLQNGWELGQRKNKERKRLKKDYKDGQAIGQGLSAEKKFQEITDEVIKWLQYGMNKYKMGTLSLVSGLYLWQFKNQRKPTSKEKKAISGKRKKK